MDARKKSDDLFDAGPFAPSSPPTSTGGALGAGPLSQQKPEPQDLIDPASDKPATQIQGTDEDALPKTHSPPEGGAAL